MVQECYSPERPARVLCFKRDGRTEVRLRRNITEDESDGGVAFWRCEESAFTVPGAMTEADAEARFDELWEEHEDDGKTAAEAAREAKTLAEQAGTQTSVAAAARMYVNASVSLTNTELADVRDLIDDFKQGGDYEKGAIRRYDGKYWRMAQKIDSTTSTTYLPGTGTESLYTLIDLAPDGIRIWHMPTDATNSFALGEKAHHPGEDGPVYVSKREGNTSEPGTDEWWELAE